MRSVALGLLVASFSFAGCAPEQAPLELDGWAVRGADELGPPVALELTEDGCVVSWPGAELSLTLPDLGFVAAEDASPVLCSADSCGAIDATVFVAEAGEHFRTEAGEEWRLAFYLEGPIFRAAVRARRIE